MLAALPPGILERVRFPLTELTKPEVREIAARHELAVAKKPESQDLCFLSGQGKGDFLRRHGGLREREGDLLDRSGKAIGRHRGHHNFTVGQRRGIGGGAKEPLYVLATNAVANTVTVGPRRDLMARTVQLRNAVLHRAGRQRRRGPPALSLAAGPGRRLRRRTPAPTPSSRSPWARTSPASRRARPRCCSPARRSSATARSPPRPDPAPDRVGRL